MMSRKHFKALAEILKDNQASDKLIQEIGSWLKSENPRFDRGRFYTAAKYEGNSDESCSSDVERVQEAG